MKPTLRTITSQTLKSIYAAPLYLLALQTLEGISSIVARRFEGHLESNPVMGVLLVFSICCIASPVSSAITFIYIRGQRSGNRLPIMEILRHLRPSFSKLVLSSLLLGFIFILGFAALILPAFYFMAIYLFVPHVLVTDSNISLSSALFRSTRTAKGALGMCLFTVMILLGSGVVTFLVSESLGRWAGGMAETTVLQHGISLSIDAFLSMASGAMIDIWISHLFLGLTANE